MGEDAGDRRITILVVDDEDHRRTRLGRWLAGAGYVVVACPTGQAALAQARALPPDLILLRAPWPDPAGAAFVAAYRQLPGPHAPVVVVSGWARAPAAG